MKRFVIVLLVIVLAFSAVAGIGFVAGKEQALPQQEQAQPQESIQPVAYEVLDFEAIKALHAPDEIVLTVDGQQIRWDEYLSWLYMSCQQTQQFIATMANYGMEVHWKDMVGEDPEETYASTSIDAAETTLCQLITLEGYARAEGIELDQESLDQIQAKKDSDMKATVGEDASEEEFIEYLESKYRCSAAYERTNLVSAISEQHLRDIYGLEGEKAEAEKVLAFLKDQQYMAANHILFMTADPQTGEALGEDEVKAMEEKARETAQELMAIEDPQERMERFLELKEELDQDTGKTAFPQGYVFLPGQMVTEFEEAAKSLEPYAVSEPVKSSFGYHVMIGVEMEPDMLVTYSNTGEALSARDMYVNYDYAQGLDKYMAALSFEYAPGFQPPVLAEYAVSSADIQD